MKRKIIIVTFCWFNIFSASAEESRLNESQQTTPEVEEASFGPYISLGIENLRFAQPDIGSFKNVSESSVGLGYQLDNHWAAEISYLTSQTSDQLSNNINFDHFSVNAVYRFTARDQTSWHTRFGIGHYSFDAHPQFSESEVTLNAGAGYDFHLNQNLFVSIHSQATYPLDRNQLDWKAGLSLNYFLGDFSSKLISRAKTAKLVIATNPLLLATDSDKDGIADQQDNCPQTPMHLMVDNNGCGLYTIDRESVVLKVNFTNDSVQVAPEYFANIESLARFMNLHQSINVTIEGHTDNVGNERYNIQLSKLRATNVAKILIQQFKVDTSRVQSMGFGEQNPIANNNNTAGRALNRRVQAVLEVEVKKPILKQ